VEALVGDAGVMGKFMKDGLSNLVSELIGIRKVCLQRYPKERDLIGEGSHVCAPFDTRNALIEAVEAGLRWWPAWIRLARLGHVLDHDGDICEKALKLGWQAVEHPLYE
jgi:hypothetical protein